MFSERIVNLVSTPASQRNKFTLVFESDGNFKS